jgi:hypothetical protein
VDVFAMDDAAFAKGDGWFLSKSVQIVVVVNSFCGNALRAASSNVKGFSASGLTTSNASFAKALWVAALKNAPQSISLAAPRKLARFVIIVSIPV